MINRGADDANTAFEAIRQGYRAVYERKLFVYEDIPRSFETSIDRRPEGQQDSLKQLSQI